LPENGINLQFIANLYRFMHEAQQTPSDGPPGVKTVWRGLQKFYTLYDYREMFDFMGQV
jgi:hypothetical protein